jgi:lysozyme family protein
MKITDELFQKYVKHVLSWEGKTSKDPRDAAASCAPASGGIHTNKGVTFCTFKKTAAALGILPVTYERFLNLSDTDIAAFVMHFAKSAHADELDTRVAVSITEAAWGSGPVRAVKHLQAALITLGYQVSIDGDMGPATRTAALSANAKELYSAYWDQRLKFIERLTAQSKFAMYRKGWLNRINSFFTLFGKP